jgi:hypothetical protein
VRRSRDFIPTTGYLYTDNSAYRSLTCTKTMVGTMTVDGISYTFDTAYLGVSRYRDRNVQAQPGSQAAAALNASG